jgi:formate/nitrite transporter
MITSPDRSGYRTGEALDSGFESLDSYRPAEISRLVRKAAVEKAGLELGPLVTRALLAGAFIAFGALFYLLVVSGTGPVTGPTRLVGGVAFSLGLVLVIVGGAELFTGNALMVMALVNRQIGVAALLRNWGVVIVGNALGGVAMAVLVLMSGLLDGEIGATARQIATAKVALGPVEMLARGILCNALVCLAVWLTFSARTAGGKTTVIILPVAAFVALGFEHCVANFFLLPLGWLSGADISPGGISRNLPFVTLGNVVGGAGGVALAYRFAYPEEARLAKPLA